MKNYCQNCGNPTDYTLVKPKFCSFCGISFGKDVIKSSIIKAKIQPVLSEDDLQVVDDVENVPERQERKDKWQRHKSQKKTQTFTKKKHLERDSDNADVNGVDDSPDDNFNDGLDDDIDDVNIVPDLNKLDVEVEKPKPSKVKIKDLIGTKSQHIDRPKEKVDKKKFMENWKKEAGAIRNS